MKIFIIKKLFNIKKTKRDGSFTTLKNAIHYNSFFLFISMFFYSTFDLLEIEFHDLLRFAFYIVIIIS
jgi:hypothetical protein